ncbi:MAG: winged helix-turn-helix domain-containing protein [Promethearchaeota archaeon]
MKSNVVDRSETIIPFKVGLKMWFKGRHEERSILGPGDILLIKSLTETKNLTNSAKMLNYSYKYAWSKLRNLEKKTGRPVVITHKGGFGGGGNVTITEWGLYLVKIFEKIQDKVNSYEKELNEILDKSSIKN